MIFLEVFLPYILIFLSVLIWFIVPNSLWREIWNELKPFPSPTKPKNDSDDIEYLFLTDHFITDMNGTDKDSSW